jgi:hypothetical protein
MKIIPSSGFRAALLAAAASLALAGCGGGGDDAPPAAEDPNAPPASASANSQGFLAFIASLSNRMLDHAEPFDLSRFTLPGDNADAAPPAATSIDDPNAPG